MKEYDTARGDDDPRLNRDHLQAWFSGRTTINDLSFSFVDQFVRRLQLSDPIYEAVRDDIIFEEGLLARSDLGKMYASRAALDDDQISSMLSVFENRVFLSPPLVGWPWYNYTPEGNDSGRYIQIAVFMHALRGNIMALKVCYSERLFDALSDFSISERLFTNYFGYLIPRQQIGSRYVQAGMFLYRRQVSGLQTLAPYTVSNCHLMPDDADYGICFQTGWVSQLSYLQAPRRNQDPAPFVPPLALANNTTMSDLENMHARNGVIDYRSTNNANLNNYFENLTDGYLIW